jgi:hypothetical protein
MMSSALDPALNVPCPTCHVKAGEPCRSRRAITLHQGRRQALADLTAQADGLLSASREPESRKPPQRKNGSSTARPVPVLVGRTGVGNVIPPDEDWPPWEKGPMARTATA